jgi:hypothetical protein
MSSETKILQMVHQYEILGLHGDTKLICDPGLRQLKDSYVFTYGLEVSPAPSSIPWIIRKQV